jgi:hypothetical protein
VVVVAHHPLATTALKIRAAVAVTVQPQVLAAVLSLTLVVAVAAHTTIQMMQRVALAGQEAAAQVETI